MTAGTLVADRVMRARRETLCPVCREPIRVGQLIARAGTWQHIRHIIERQHEAAAGPLPLDVTREGDHILVRSLDGRDTIADLDPATAHRLARQLDDAARPV